VRLLADGAINSGARPATRRLKVRQAQERPRRPMPTTTTAAAGDTESTGRRRRRRLERRRPQQGAATTRTPARSWKPTTHAARAPDGADARDRCWKCATARWSSSSSTRSTTTATWKSRWTTSTRACRKNSRSTSTNCDGACRCCKASTRPAWARASASECLALQIKRMPGVPMVTRRMALAIVETHLTWFAQREFNKLKKALDCDDEDLREAQAVIRQCNPHPGAAFASDVSDYVVPDVIVKKARNGWQVS
jgi:hypothetical protein